MATINPSELDGQFFKCTELYLRFRREFGVSDKIARGWMASDTFPEAYTLPGSPVPYYLKTDVAEWSPPTPNE